MPKTYSWAFSTTYPAISNLAVVFLVSLSTVSALKEFLSIFNILFSKNKISICWQPPEPLAPFSAFATISCKVLVSQEGLGPFVWIHIVCHLGITGGSLVAAAVLIQRTNSNDRVLSTSWSFTRYFPGGVVNQQREIFFSLVLSQWRCRPFPIYSKSSINSTNLRDLYI